MSSNEESPSFENRKSNITRRAAIAGGIGLAGFLAGRSVMPALPNRDGILPLDAQTSQDTELTLNDASLLSKTPIYKHIKLQKSDMDLVEKFRRILSEARQEGRPVNIGAARHSMGGQAIPRDGIAISVDNARLEPDTAAGVYRVCGGARWFEVIAALDSIGFSPAVMQSNNDFGVAATFSVNAHGWPTPFGPMGATVRSLRMVLPDGELVTASRYENPELFGLAMGGYGLIGLIVDLEVEMVANQRLYPTFEVVKAHDFPSVFRKTIDDPLKPMVYGRLNVDRSNLFEEALLVSYSPSADQSNIPAARGSGVMSHLASYLYRMQVGRENMKRMRWRAETGIAPLFAGESTRNSLMNEPVATLDDRDPNRVDILHEYFIPFEAFDGFLVACREVIPNSFVEFLNVTLRYVDSDHDSWLAHSPTPRIAAVMSFTQELTHRAEEDHARMTRDLIDRVLELGGSYYLPYRPHARIDQFTTAYPRANAFAQAKRRIDPGLVLRNNLWDQYLGAL